MIDFELYRTFIVRQCGNIMFFIRLIFTQFQQTNKRNRVNHMRDDGNISLKMEMIQWIWDRRKQMC